MSKIKEIKLSATVILMRDSAQGVEFLLTKKSDAVSFLPGHWVFPGGAVDDSDARENELDTLKAACVRETQEEISVDISGLTLTSFAHWITPQALPKQFSTWFFLAALPDGLMQSVKVDGSELVDSMWLSADQAISLHQTRHAAMVPPTLIALMRLQSFTSVADIELEQWPTRVKTIRPQAAIFDGELAMLYPGDSAYGLTVDNEGERHRCTENSGVWCYVNSVENSN
ncbi:MAG: NUDIX domain-containing protein [Sinobacterium sp.]|nr:NUDIX domain-containing protein [Sinobacterium sp.]